MVTAFFVLSACFCFWGAHTIRGWRRVLVAHLADWDEPWAHNILRLERIEPTGRPVTVPEAVRKRLRRAITTNYMLETACVLAGTYNVCIVVWRLFG